MSSDSALDHLSTEAPSFHDDLEHKSSYEILQGINQEDHKVAKAVKKTIPQINALIENIIPRLNQGGRIFYIGAGTSGRLGILDASECPPTYGVSPELIVGLIAGGEKAIRSAVENAEDDSNAAWAEIKKHIPTHLDTVIGIAASGSTPYVIGGLSNAKKNGLLTGCIVCNQNSLVASEAQYPIEVIVGPEFVTGSTRMKSGTAQKMILNMISTTLMIKIGKVKGNKMVDMQLSNHKLVERGTKMIMKESGIEYDKAKQILIRTGSVRKSLIEIQKLQK
jgi:N-acetylmuramic acid 6-phosphate etherase